MTPQSLSSLLAAFGGLVAAVTIVWLVALLLVQAHGGPELRSLRRALGVGVLPLVLVFAAVVSLRLARFAGLW